VAHVRIYEERGESGPDWSGPDWSSMVGVIETMARRYRAAGAATVAAMPAG
jgi:hypothetical protein